MELLSKDMDLNEKVFKTKLIITYCIYSKIKIPLEVLEFIVELENLDQEKELNSIKASLKDALKNCNKELFKELFNGVGKYE